LVKYNKTNAKVKFKNILLNNVKYIAIYLIVIKKSGFDLSQNSKASNAKFSQYSTLVQTILNHYHL
jgi:hypothetical protein